MPSVVRQAALDSRIVTNLDDAPAELLSRTGQRVQTMIAAADTPSTT
jgi:hypothetical protein